MNEEMDDISILKIVWELIRFGKGKFFLRVIGLTLFFLSPLVTTYLVKEIFDKLDGSPNLPLDIWTVIILIPIIAFARIGVNIITVILQFMFVQSSQVLLRSNLLSGILKQPGAAALKDSSPGEAISRFRGDVREIAWFVSFTAYIFAYGIFFVIAFGTMFVINRTAATMVIIPYLVVLIVIYKGRKKQKEYRRLARRAAGQVTGMVGETFGAIQSIKVASAEESITTHFSKLGEERRRAAVKDATFQAFLRSFGSMMVTLNSGILLFVVANDMRSGLFSVGDFAFFIFLLGWMQGFVNNLGELISWQARASVSFKRLSKLNKGVRSNSDPKELLENHDIYLDKQYKAKPWRKDEPEPLKELSVNDLSIRHKGGNSEFWLRDISFSLQRGEFTVIIGKVGSGKTTLLRGMLGLLPVESGEILWNGSPVVVPSEFFTPPVSTYTPQLPTLFSTTIRENLQMGLDKEVEEIKEAVKLSVLNEDLEDFESGLDTVIGPKGIKLSGGQKYRVAAARMLLRKSELIVVDDLSSALDVTTENELWEGLFRTQNSTFLVVSHRPAVLRRADKILVMDKGKLIAQGKLDDLLPSNSIVSEIMEMIEEKRLTPQNGK